MRTLVAVLVLGVCATSARAEDLQGKWGLGAGLFNNRSEASLLYGHSDRVAWVFTLSGDISNTRQSGDTSSLPGTQVGLHQSDFTLGPSVRVFTRPEEAFSPYFEIFTHGSWSHRKPEISGVTASLNNWSASVGLAMGAEYFLTRWHCSLALHTQVVSLDYDHRKTEVDGLSITDRSLGANVAISPGLLARVYF